MDKNHKYFTEVNLQKNTTTCSFSARIFSNIFILTSSILPGISSVSSSLSQDSTSSSSLMSPEVKEEDIRLCKGGSWWNHLSLHWHLSIKSNKRQKVRKSVTSSRFPAMLPFPLWCFKIIQKLTFVHQRLFVSEEHQ